jgi:hypothetical protein
MTTTEQQMGYALMMGRCYACTRPFGFNPHKVPSITIQGVREPLCKKCVEEANRRRKAGGLQEFKIDPQAYEAIEESEL